MTDKTKVTRIPENAACFDAEFPWFFETETGGECFATEEEALAAQQEYRAEHGWQLA